MATQNVPPLTVYVISRFKDLAQTVEAELQRRGQGRDQIKIVNYPLAEKGKPNKSWFHLFIDDNEFLENEADKIENVISEVGVLIQLLSRSSNRIKYAQVTHTGVDRLFKTDKILNMQKDLQIVKFGGQIFQQMVGEYVIGSIVSRERKFATLVAYQEQRKYARNDVVPFRVVSSMSVGVLGVGNLGGEVLRLLKTFRATTWAAVRDERFNDQNQMSVPNADHVIPMSRLRELLSEVDYLVNVLPSTDETRGLLSGDTLAACQPKKTVFINVGRGDIIDEESLVSALSKGWLGGAILDVHHTEPLPVESPLWSLTGVSISPHCAVCFSESSERALDYVDNLERLFKGQPLLHQVNLERGY